MQPAAPPKRPPVPRPVAPAPTPQKQRPWSLGPRAQRLMWDAHSATGVALGLVLFVIFFCGAFALYRAPLDAWADPALRGQPTLSTEDIVGPVFAERPPEPGSGVTVVYAFGERRTVLLIYNPAGETTPEGDPVRAVLTYSTTTGEELAPGGRSRLSLVLFQLHFLLQLRHVLPGSSLIGIAIAGVFAVFMLFALVSGVLIHLKKLPKDWHTFRPRGTVRTALADAHTVLGLAGLPYAVMYAVTGGIISIMIMLAPQIETAFFDGDGDAYDAAIYGVGVPEADSTGRAAAMLGPDALVAALPESWAGIDPILVRYSRWGDAGATATLHGHVSETLTTSGKATLRAATGDVIAHNPPTTPTALGATYAVTEQLHYGDVGGWLLDALFFLLALATGAVILTGNALWIVVRRPKDPRATPRLHRVLGRLTVGFGCGLVAAVPVLFILAHAIPTGAADRKVWEEALFFAAWFALIAAAFAGPSTVGAARWQLALAAGLCLLVPVANGWATGDWLWASAANARWQVFWIDLSFVFAALVLVWTAQRLRPVAPDRVPVVP